MSAKPLTPNQTLSQPIAVTLVAGEIRAEVAPEGSPRWAYLEGRRVGEHILAQLDLAALIDERAELAAHELVMLRAKALRHPAVTYAVEIQWRAGVRAVVDEAWKAAMAGVAK